MTAPITIRPPSLATLDTKPTWLNRTGRVDRSACLVLTAVQLWRRIPADDWTYRYPARQPAHHAKGKCDRFADLTLTARCLWLMHKFETPYRLQGDFRSAKTNAMRAHATRTNSSHPGQAQRTAVGLGQGTINPNRGVGFNLYKRLGLDCLWQTILRIERYVQHAQLKQHFLVCPVCAPVAAGQRTGVEPSKTRDHDPTPACYAAARKHNSKLPLGRVTKLYLPLCTEREREDAQLAQLWLKTHVHPNLPLPPIAVQLIERYAELFEPRNLRCRQCLGLRYGEVKPNQNMKRKRVPHACRELEALAYASSSDKSSPRVTRRQSEQSLFLTNLPKLLAPVPDASPTQRRRASASDQSSINNHPSKSIRDQLLHLLAGSMPAFKKLGKVKQLPK